MSERACGTRVQDGIYIEVPTRPYGRPLGDFLVDPPTNIADWKISSRGMHFFQRPDDQTGEMVYHLLDVVGRKYYPNVADFIEEAKVLGISRRVQSTINFAKLDPIKSRLLIAHRKGYMHHLEDYHPWKCPHKLEHHRPDIYVPGDPRFMCVGAYWSDIVQGEPVGDGDEVVRKLPNVTYKGYRRTQAVSDRWDKQLDPYERAIFMSLPIPRFVVIKSKSTDYELHLAKVQQGRIPVEGVDA